MLFKNLKLNRGFTLVELVVVMAIATIMVTSLIIQQSKWNDRLTVNAQAYELALMIRQAQIYSLGVREDTGGSGNKFNVGYGVYIDEDLPSNQYIFFADRNGDKAYNSGEMIGGAISLTRGVTIEKFCGATGPKPCNNDTGPLNQLVITFFRPEPKANIALLNPGGGSGGTNPPATIYLKSVGGRVSSVKVEDNGQISVQ
ncbi:MAG: type II secretion system protein [Candidatus Zambryskibacteria bacterium]